MLNASGQMSFNQGFTSLTNFISVESEVALKTRQLLAVRYMPL